MLQRATAAARAGTRHARCKGPRVTVGTTHCTRALRHLHTQIWHDGKQLYLGSFASEQQAALTYDLVAMKFRGPSAGEA